MKKLINVCILSVVVCFVLSCDIIDERRTKARFTIINDTDVTVNINFLFEEGDMNNFTESLNPNESYEGNTIESSVGGIFDDPEKSVVGALFGDSISIIFDNESTTSYSLMDTGNSTPIYTAPINRNIFRSGNYEEVSEENFIYTITQEDYNNATPCDGPCE